MSRWLYEYDTGDKYGPCSDENWAKWENCKKDGRPYFIYPAFGYSYKMTARGEDASHPPPESNASLLTLCF